MHTRLREIHRQRRRPQSASLRRYAPMGLIAQGLIAVLVVLMSHQNVEAQADAAKIDAQAPPQKQPKAIPPPISPAKPAQKGCGGCAGKVGEKGCGGCADKAAAKTAGGSKGKPAAKGCGSKSASAAKPIKLADGAKWVCEKPKIVRDEIWRGQPIVCDFAIRNDGTEALTYTARGG